MINNQCKCIYFCIYLRSKNSEILLEDNMSNVQSSPVEDVPQTNVSLTV